ncbi:MAG: hypothetical protein JXR25_15865 [Pontiellaceae bacterium]|nr:hypothetical protein [Pontiellaceae bacterium]MBN2786297.1 hypothetical protein [Pontiellaceae bacterium]
MSGRIRLAVLIVLNLTATTYVGAEPFIDHFTSSEIDDAWHFSGPVNIDNQRGRDDRHMSLKIGPKGMVTLMLRNSDGSGSLTLWVYDDLGAPAQPKVRRAGPQWGLVDSRGKRLVVGSIYAPYLNGAATFSAAEYIPPKEQPFFNVQYLGEKRESGWHKWTFNMDPDQGLLIKYDDKPVKRYSWDKSKFLGFAGIVLVGDSTEADAQTLWVDDVEVRLGPAMNTKPMPPPPPAPVVPETDPEITAEAVCLLPEIRGVHPRLFFGPADIPALREKYQSPAMKMYRTDLQEYLGACYPPDHTHFLTDATDGQR